MCVVLFKDGGKVNSKKLFGVDWFLKLKCDVNWYIMYKKYGFDCGKKKKSINYFFIF